MSIRFTRVCAWALALPAVALVAETPLWASVAAPRVPEIDGGAISAGLGLLAAGVLMLRARRSSK